jgi:hypothetical protein
MSEAHPGASGHETRDVNFNGIFGLAVLIIVSGIVVIVGVWWLFQDLRERQKQAMPPRNPLALEQSGNLPPPPQLEGIERMKELGKATTVPSLRPSSYGWVDRKAEVVRVPLDRAMTLIVEQKLVPSKSGSDNRDLRNPYATMPSPANSGRGAPREQP